MPRHHFAPPSSFVSLEVQRVSCERAGREVLHEVSFIVAPGRRVGVIGPNGVGKSTLLEIIAREREPDTGRVEVDPPSATIGLLAQEHARDDHETVRELLARRSGALEANEELARAARALAEGAPGAPARYERALARYEALGAGDVDARIDAVLDALGLRGASERRSGTLSGGERSKVALAAMEVSRFDVTLLDEPTNDLDFDGLERLESWVRSLGGPLVIVSHDREFLARTVTDVLEIDEFSRRGTLYTGGYESYLAERDTARRRAREAFEVYERRRETLEARAQRHREWAVAGVKREKKSPRDNDKAQRDFRINRTEKQASRVRRVENALENLEAVEAPFEGWNLRFSIAQTQRSGDTVVRLVRARVDRDGFTLGPLDLVVGFGDRIALTGPNGSGKTTLVGALLGTLELTSGERWSGPSVVTGLLGQDRRALRTKADLVSVVSERCALGLSEARSLLAKFGLRADQATRPTRTLSPGERTRAELAIFQGRGVNCLVLDEPTNHLDLPAIEQLEEALDRYSGTLIMVTHDRRLLERVHATRRLELRAGQLTQALA